MDFAYIMNRVVTIVGEDIMKKIHNLLILLPLLLIMSACGEDKLSPVDDGDGEGESQTQTVPSYSRNYELIANYNNDECFNTLFDAVSFITCSVISVPAASSEEMMEIEPILKNIQSATFYVSGREIMGNILNLNHEEKTDSKLYNDAVAKYETDAIGYINDLSNSTITDTEGATTTLDDFIYDQYVEFTNYDSKFRETHEVKTGSAITRNFELIPNYNNDDCFTTTFTDQDFLSCSLIAINSIRIPENPEGVPEFFLSGREMLARTIEASLDPQKKTDKELYELAKDTFENHGLFLEAFKDLGYSVITAEKIVDLYEVLKNQAEEYRLYREANP
jgi:hypothetical protein